MHAWPVERDQRKTRLESEEGTEGGLGRGEETRGLMPPMPKPPRETIGWDRMGLGVRHLGTGLAWQVGLGWLWAREGTRAAREALSRRSECLFFPPPRVAGWLAGSVAGTFSSRRPRPVGSLGSQAYSRVDRLEGK